jgi:hypothetical protein
VKEAWELVKMMRLGANRVKDVNAQKLLKEFENISFNEGETIDDFGMRINNLVANLKSLGDTVEDTRVVKKFLRVMPSRFSQVVVSIEMFCDLKTLTIEELVGQLCAAEDRLEDKVEQVTDKAGRLLLAEEDWLEKHKHRFQSNPTKEGAHESSGSTRKGKAPHRGEGRNSSSTSSVKLMREGTPRCLGRCYNYGIYGHYAKDCKHLKEKKGAKQPEENVAMGPVDQQRHYCWQR